jgi:superfamily I DNA and/or RNA helicase
VLIGDPRQLDQPVQGSHPEGTDVSALDHILDGLLRISTIPADKGLFLGQTWRLHPSICAFTSELFYEGKLTARTGLENIRVKVARRWQARGSSTCRSPIPVTRLVLRRRPTP